MKSRKRTLQNLWRVEGKGMSLKAFARMWAGRDRRWCNADCSENFKTKTVPKKGSILATPNLEGLLAGNLGFNPCTSITVEQTKTAREKEGGTDIAAG